ncbi:uncharacterized protein LOC123712948 [Pieris brassicae]|uniref:MADF domain-containing protein n=1 Tax=Pieris brassicae TaxID=7116 RepID=A0A9P0XCK6_PIEBR|nr:uncharacterized protein LOC123712948 [Pieris brassicae]CAH4029863.1 unnamed protein product [Pieris brassicae]
MFEINPIKLIKSIKSRPALYTKNDPMYSHRKHKDRLWREVCMEVHPSWDELKPVERVEGVRDIQKRWKSLRTCYTRELKLQRRERFKVENSIAIRKRKRYGYFNDLTFLGGDTTDVEIKYSDDDSDPLEAQYETEDIDFAFTDPQEVSIVPEAYEEEQSDVLESKKKARDEDDDDRQFVMSLIPMFRKLSDRRKLEARIEVMRVLQKITFDDVDKNRK